MGLRANKPDIVAPEVNALLISESTSLYGIALPRLFYSYKTSFPLRRDEATRFHTGVPSTWMIAAILRNPHCSRLLNFNVIIGAPLYPDEISKNYQELGLI